MQIRNSRSQQLILLADDNPNNIQLLGSFLGKYYETAVAVDGPETLKFVTKKVPDLILLDIMMPGMDGFEVCERLKQSPETEKIPIIFLSAKTETEDIVRGFHAGAADYISKPFCKEELLARVETHLRFKESEETLRQTIGDCKKAKEAAETAAKVKSDFIATVSHEIRTPMNAIIGLTQLALQVRPDPVQSGYLKKIESAARILLRIINDILDFSKIEAGKLKLELTNFDLDHVVTDLSEMMAVPAEKKGLGLRFIVDQKIPPLLLGDPLRLEQILINLINNAIKFTNRGEITVRAELMEKEKDDRIIVKFSIRDTGIGISPEHMPKLFKSFVQADGSITRKYGGTGLGLTISKHLTEIMGGQLYADSTPNEGSTFYFTAEFGHPAENEQKTTGQIQDLSGLHKIRGLRVLIVEDNDINQELACDFLKLAGMVTEVANDGSEAVTRVRNSSFDLVFMDIMMPVTDGYEATRQIRKYENQLAGGPEASRRLPIIAMTANAMDGEREKCLAAGMDDYLVKPFDRETLLGKAVEWALLPEKETYQPKNPEDGVKKKEDQQNPLFPESLPGIDIKAGLRGANNNKKLYIKCLIKFYNSYKDAVDKIRKSLAEKSTEEARMMVHTLKSIAGQLGALDLYAATGELETEIAKGEAGEDGVFFRFENPFKEVMEGLASVKNSEITRCFENTADAPLHPSHTESCLKELSVMLERGDADALIQVKEVGKQLSDEYLGLVEMLEIQVGDLDFKNAKSTLNILTDLITHL